MNIIISSLDEINVVGSTTNVDISDIRFYSFKDKDELIPKLIPKFVTFKSSSSIDSIQVEREYLYELVEASLFNKPNYICYKIKENEKPCNFPNEQYDIKVTFADESYKEIKGPYSLLQLVDEHGAVLVTDRKIDQITTPIVAQDRNSQQIVFHLKKCYDGISFLDETKEIFVDYIPVDFIPIIDDNGNTINFYSSLIHDKNLFTDAQGVEWVEIKWNIPPAAIEKAGIVKYDIAVVDRHGDVSYVWQTLPSSFTVSENLAKRPLVLVEPNEKPDILADLIDEINSLNDFVANLDNVSAINENEGTITYTSRENGVATETEYSVLDLATATIDEEGEEEIEVGGGGAPIGEGATI